MLFFKKPNLPEPDVTRLRLYRGAYYPYDDVLPPNRVYTLREWAEDSDADFPEIAMECALTILDEYPVVVNHLSTPRVGETVREDEEVKEYLKSISWRDLGGTASVVTMTNGPDRKLAATFDHDNEFYQMSFYGFRQFADGGAERGTPFIPDVELRFLHLHDRLTITTREDIEVYAEKIRAVCEKYGKTLVVQELPSRGT